MTQGELWPGQTAHAGLAPRVRGARIEKRLCWYAPHGVLPLVLEDARRLRPALRIATAEDLLVALDALRDHGLASHPEITRQALVELATKDPHWRLSRRWGWMTLHRYSAMRFAVQRFGVDVVARHARLQRGTVLTMAARGQDAHLPDLWDGTIWGPAHNDTAQGDPLHATRPPHDDDL